MLCARQQVVLETGVGHGEHGGDHVAVCLSAQIGNAVLPVSASLGVAWTTSGGIGPNVLIQEADEALYKAKTLGRNRVEVCATGTT